MRRKCFIRLIALFLIFPSTITNVHSSSIINFLGNNITKITTIVSTMLYKKTEDNQALLNYDMSKNIHIIVVKGYSSSYQTPEDIVNLVFKFLYDTFPYQERFHYYLKNERIHLDNYSNRLYIIKIEEQLDCLEPLSHLLNIEQKLKVKNIAKKLSELPKVKKSLKDAFCNIQNEIEKLSKEIPKHIFYKYPICFNTLVTISTKDYWC